jgi:hypothetical protein
MKKSIMEKWVAALRGGEYMQGYGVLRQQGGSEPLLCALGVLCQLHHDETRSAGWWHRPLDDCWAYGRVNIRPGDRDTFTACLPQCVMEWAEIASPTGRLDAGRTVSTMNDDGLPFDAIADAIEKQWPLL